MLGALYMMLSLLVRSIIRGTAVPMGRAPSDLVGSLRADQLEELMNELRGLRSELKGASCSSSSGQLRLRWVIEG